MDKVSIVIPIYNSEKLLNKCLDSIINQTYNNLEIILVNDGSTDNSLNIIKEYAKKDDRIVFYDKKNEGVSKTKNFGINKATGKYISFVDSDDYIEDNMIEKVVNFINEKNLDIVKFHYNNYIDGKLNNTNLFYPDKKLLSTKKDIDDFKIRLLSGEIPGYMQLLMINRKFLGDLRINENINFLEDLTFYLSLLSKKAKIGILNDRLYNYVNNKNGLTFSLNKDKIISRIEGTLLYYDYAISISKGKETQVICNSCTYLLMHSFFELYRVDRKNKMLIEDYLKDDKITNVFKGCNINKLDRFTRNALKCINNNHNFLYLHLFITKLYILIKELL